MLIAICIILVILTIYYCINSIFLSRSEFEKTVDDCVYFKLLNKHDLYHRNCTTHLQYIEKYKAAYTLLTAWEKINIYMQIQMLNLPKKLRITFYIVRLRFDKSIEMSFPHTINNCIILNDIYFNDDYDQQCNTIIHELIHIYQRIYPNDIEKLINQMNFYKINNDVQELINSLDLPIANSSDLPMTNVYCYINGGNIYILHMIYKNNKLHDICIDINGSISQIDLKSNLSQQGHPYEITAEVISRVLTNTYTVRADWIEIINNWLIN
jgi:hypothetical protein